MVVVVVVMQAGLKGFLAQQLGVPGFKVHGSGVVVRGVVVVQAE